MLSSHFIDAIHRAGGIPVVLPPYENDAGDQLERIDGLIISGGSDIDPSHYGGEQHPEVYEVDRVRDAGEIALVRLAAERGLPTLGICRGAQMINVALGGSLIEHLPDAVDNSIQHRADPPGAVLHAVHIDAGSRLAEIVGNEVIAPASWHHQAIRTLAPGLVITARAPDGVIEAVELPSHPWLIAVQWHPEMTAVHDPVQQLLFNSLVQGAQLTLEKRRAG